MRRPPSPPRRRSDTLEQILAGLMIGSVFALAFGGVVACIVAALVRRLA